MVENLWLMLTYATLVVGIVLGIVAVALDAARSP